MKSMLFLANRLHNLLTAVNHLLTIVNPADPAERSHSAQKPRLQIRMKRKHAIKGMTIWVTMMSK